jgi:hypothetical protein
MLTVTLQSKKDGRLAPLEAKIALPQVIADGFEFLRGYVHDASGNTVGQVTLDIRTLNSDAWTQEILAHRAWSPGKESTIAHNLATQASDYIVVNFEPAVVAFSSLAVTPEGSTALARKA